MIPWSVNLPGSKGFLGRPGRRAGLTLVSGVVIMARMRETLGASR
jgi:hypothetical protein